MYKPATPDINIQRLNSTNDEHRITGSADVHVKRMRGAVIWSIILQFLFLFVFILFVNFNIFHPVSWLFNCFYMFLSLRVWLKLVVFVIIIYIQGEVCKKDYVTGPQYYSTRFQKMKQVFSMRNVLLLLLHMVIGITVFWIYSSMTLYYSLTEQCKSSHTSQSPEVCLVEKKLFLLLGGLWLGMYYFANDYMFGIRNLSFPLIQQYKIYRVKAALRENIKLSMKGSVLPTFIFLILYYFYGGFIRIRSMELMSCTLDTEPIDSFQGILNLQLIVSLWLFSCIFFVALKMMELLFNAYLTEHCVFPVSTTMLPQGKYLSLADSLKASNVPIIQHLGYLDLFTLSTKTPERRKELFTLSQPGGHPHSWNGAYKECINLIKIFTNDLNLAMQVTVNAEKELHKSPPKTEPVSFHFHSHSSTGIRRLASPVGTRDVSNVLGQLKQNQSAVEVVFNNLQKWLKLKHDQMYKKPYIAYFFVESPDSRINYLLCQCQPVIWAIQSLAHLAAASLSEDRYGIVQRDLPEIIVTIVSLKQVLDKLFKQNLIVKKSFANDPLDAQMKYLLRTSVKRSLYKIAVTFGPYIKDLRLPCEVEVQMNNFIEFKEVL